MNWIFSLLKFIGIENFSDLKNAFSRSRQSESEALKGLNKIERCLLFLAYPDQGIFRVGTVAIEIRFTLENPSDSNRKIYIDLKTDPPPSITFGKIRTVGTDLPNTFVHHLQLLKDIHFCYYRGKFKLTPAAKILVRENYPILLRTTVDYFKDNLDFDLGPYFLPTTGGD